jgi:hypothetical protein
MLKQCQLFQMAELMLGQKLYQYQESILEAGLQTSSWRMVNSSRQVGKSTTIALEAAINSLFYDNHLVVLISLADRKAVELLDMVRSLIASVGPNFYKEHVQKDSSEEIGLRCGSRIVSLGAGTEIGLKKARGYTADAIYVDEAAHIKYQDLLLEAVAPAAVRKGKVLLSSTPNGVGDLFHQLWIGDNNLWKIEIPWTACPGLTEERIEEAKVILAGKGKSFAQEYECSFENKAESIWNWTELQDITLEEWEEGNKGIRIAGFDPAQSRHSSAFVVLNKKGRRKEVIHLEDFRGLPYPDQAKKVMERVREYQVSKLVLDEGGIGKAVYDLLSPIQHKTKRVNFSKKFKNETAHSIKAEADMHNFYIREVPLSDQLKQDLFMFDSKRDEFPETKNGHGDFGCALFLAWSGAKRNYGEVDFKKMPSLRASQPCLADREKGISSWMQ